jgi:hypothetical protein
MEHWQNDAEVHGGKPVKSATLTQISHPGLGLNGKGLANNHMRHGAAQYTLLPTYVL